MYKKSILEGHFGTPLLYSCDKVTIRAYTCRLKRENAYTFFTFYLSFTVFIYYRSFLLQVNKE